MGIILGIDPGSRQTGYGVIESAKGKQHYLSSGCIRTTDTNFVSRLKEIFEGITEIIQQFQPAEVAIEDVFVNVINPRSALKLGQARGVAIAALSALHLEVAEYSAREVKQALVGTGGAEKKQVQHMVKTLLQLSATPQADAADALAVAMCHATSSKSLPKRRRQQKRWRQI